MTQAIKVYEENFWALQIGKARISWGLAIYKQCIWITQDQELHTMMLTKSHDISHSKSCGSGKNCEKAYNEYIIGPKYERMWNLMFEVVLLVNKTSNNKKLAGLL